VIIETRDDSITHEVVENITVSVSITSQSTEPRRRVGSLNDLLREFLKNEGKRCVTIGTNILYVKKNTEVLLLALPVMEMY
jgi:hypothetical protein